MPPRESGLVGPPEPVRTDFFAGLGLGVARSDGDDGSSDFDEDDGIHSHSEEDDAPSTQDHHQTSSHTNEEAEEESDFDEEQFQPPRNRWGTRAGHGYGGGSVSSGSTIGSSDVTTTPVNGVGFGGGRPWSSVMTDASGSSAGSGRTMGTGMVSGEHDAVGRVVSGGAQAWMSPGPWASPAGKGGGETK